MKPVQNGERFRLCAVVTLFLVSSTLPAVAQNVQINGAFHGTVSDPTGAVIPGARVLVTNVSNGQVRESTTSETGFYTITQLAPGHYSVSVSKQGFTTVAQADVELLVNQDLEADYTLRVGQVTQEIQVTAAPTMLKTASATLGQVIGSQNVVDLPLNGRQFVQLVLLTPGAAPREGGQQATFVVPIGSGGISPSTNGQQGTQNVFTIDGILDNAFFSQNWTISPPPDAIREFNVQSHITDAQFSMSSGANVNLVTKSGGRELHGDLWEFLRNDALDAANFFDNFSNRRKPPFRQNQYGFTVGGPVMLPYYDGRKKNTYFFGYWEGFRSSQGFTLFDNFPTSQELGGDFSDLLTAQQAKGANGQPLFDNLGRPILNGQIYNPYSTRQVTAGQGDSVTGVVATGSGLVRDPFNGNIISPALLTPEALTYIRAFYPAPNLGPGGNSFPNFVGSSSRTITSNQFGVGLDHTFGNNDTLSGKFYYSQSDEVFPTNLKLGPGSVGNHARVVSLAYTHLFSPTLLASFHYGYTWTSIPDTNKPGGESLLNAINAQGILPVHSGIPIVPQITIGPRLTGTSQFAIALGPMRSHEFTADVQKVHGSHSFSTGLLYFRIHSFDDGFGTTLGFDQFPTSGIFANNVNQASTGDGLASMLLNLPASLVGFFGNTSADMTTHWVGSYVQDKWQLSKKLNIQFGLRWDFLAPPHYKDNQFTMWNMNCPMGTFTTQDQIRAIEQACLMMPIPFVPPPTASNPNPLSWQVPNARKSLWDPKYNGWQPRFGFSYAATTRTVIHGAFAIFDDHNQYQQEMQDPRGSWPFGGNVLQFSLNRGVPSEFMNHLPSATSFLQGASPVFGRAGDPRAQIPYAMEYNLGVERQITPNMTLSADYVGSGGRHLWGDVDYNQPLPEKMGPNAFNNLPFPFIVGTIQGNVNIFTNNYNALQLKLEKRFSEGLSFLGSYTWSKCLDEFSGEFSPHPQNTYNIRGDYGPCEYNFPHIFSFSYAYRLPFGRGMRFASNVGRGANALIGGWNMSGVTSAHSGIPFNVTIPFDNANSGNGFQRANVVPGCQLLPSGFRQDVFHWYNPACFTLPAQFTFGNLARNALRGPDLVNFDFTLYKNFSLTESKSVQFRTEVFNIFNRSSLSPPGATAGGALGGTVRTSILTPTFMRILNAAAAREIQFALKFIF